MYVLKAHINKSLFYIYTLGHTGGCGSSVGGYNNKVGVVIGGVVSSDRKGKKQVSTYSASSRSSQLRSQ